MGSIPSSSGLFVALDFDVEDFSIKVGDTRIVFDEDGGDSLIVVFAEHFINFIYYRKE